MHFPPTLICILDVKIIFSGPHALFSSIPRFPLQMGLRFLEKSLFSAVPHIEKLFLIAPIFSSKEYFYQSMVNEICCSVNARYLPEEWNLSFQIRPRHGRGFESASDIGRSF